MLFEEENPYIKDKITDKELQQSKDDCKILKIYDITHKQISDKIDSIFDKCYDKEFKIQYHNCVPLTIKPGYFCNCARDIIYMKCPFDGCYVETEHEQCYIMCIKTNKWIEPNPILSHLISIHKIFGINNYRIDPKTLIDILNIKPNVNYKRYSKEYPEKYSESDFYKEWLEQC